LTKSSSGCSVDGAGSNGVRGVVLAVVDGEVSVSANGLEDVPHVAVVGGVVVLGEGLGSGFGGDGASGRGGGQLEDLVVNVVLDGGGASGPDVVTGRLLVDGVEAIGGATFSPGSDGQVDLSVEGVAGGSEEDIHATVGVEGVKLGEVRGGCVDSGSEGGGDGEFHFYF